MAQVIIDEDTCNPAGGDLDISPHMDVSFRHSPPLPQQFLEKCKVLVLQHEL